MGRSEVQQKYSMRFFLPASEIKTKSEAPTPSREGVRVVDVPERTVAVRTFSGYFRRENVDANTKALLESLKGD